MNKGVSEANSKRVWSIESREKQRVNTLARHKNKSFGMYGKPAWNLGKTKFNDERVRQYSEKLVDRKFSPEHKKKISLSRIGEKNWNYKKIMPEKQRELISKGNKGKVRTAETRRKYAESKRGWHPPPIKEETRRKLRIARRKRTLPKYDTKPERMMQIALTLNGIKFEKQKLVETDNFYHKVDLFIEPNICLEVDGIRWHIPIAKIKRDLFQTQELTIMGYHVIRIRDKDILKNTQNCAETVIRLINDLREGVRLL